MKNDGDVVVVVALFFVSSFFFGFLSTRAFPTSQNHGAGHGTQWRFFFAQRWAVSGIVLCEQRELPHGLQT